MTVHFTNIRTRSCADLCRRVGQTVVTVTLFLAFLTPLRLWAEDDQVPPDLADQSLEQLLNVQVTTVSRKAEKLSKTPAAVYVINQEAIRRSGATTIPDLLRMAPGVQVAQIDASRWAISIRGFNDVYSDKVLVLVDGRTVYTPDFSGVYWDQIAIPLDTIDRIEVVRGPGGTMWGANAMNGVINIITMHSKETVGESITAGGGNNQTGDYEARIGGKIGSNATYRISGDFNSFASLSVPSGASARDGWDREHIGGRADWNPSSRDTFVLEGDGFLASGGQTVYDVLKPQGGYNPISDSGGDGMLRWTRQYSERSEGSLQVYDSSYLRREYGFSERLNQLDFDYQNRIQLGSRNDLVWGAGYRFNKDSVTSIDDGSHESVGIQLIPHKQSFSLFSTFVQDTVQLASNLSLSGGVKLEHNAFSGFEFEPSARLAWDVTSRQTLWAAVAKAIRQPSRLDTALDVNSTPVPLSSNLLLSEHITGNPDIQAEQLHDYEAGYRFNPTDKLTLDFTGFTSFYSELTAPDLLMPQLIPTGDQLTIIMRLQYGNPDKASSYGAESAVSWIPASIWKISATYSWLRVAVDPYGSLAQQRNAMAAGVAALTPVLGSAFSQALLGGAVVSPLPNSGTSETSPVHQASFRSYLDLTRHLGFDTSVYFTSRLRGDTVVPAYTRLDSQLSWKAGKRWDVSIIGQNLLSPRHLEFGNTSQVLVSEVTRSFSARIRRTF